MLKFFKLLNCFIFGHKWQHIKTIKIEKPIPNARAVWIEQSYNLWRCDYCNSNVQVKLTKQPNNTRRMRFELISNLLNDIIED